MDLGEIRNEIDAIDKNLVEQFEKRMALCREVADYKIRNGMQVLDRNREQEKMNAIADMADCEFNRYGLRELFTQIMSISRKQQYQLLADKGVITGLPFEMVPNLQKTKAQVVYQGVEGAYSQLACDRLFTLPNVFYCATFDAVFSAIESGLCRYGVIPVENSTAGSVNAVYDLMMRHNFRIVRSVRLKIDHCLLARPGAQLSDIKEIYSHEQAISQCSRFLQGLPGVTVVRCENTAAAAKRVAESGRTDVAALASRACVGLYGLESLAASVQDQGNNYTRFVCIAKDLEIYPGADRTSLMMVLPHKPGSLYKVLSRFYALGINLNKLESRPLPERDFEFMFYFDLETSVYSPQFRQLMGELPGLCEEFSYLGSYQEVV